jgi:hypothetical protein
VLRRHLAVVELFAALAVAGTGTLVAVGAPAPAATSAPGVAIPSPVQTGAPPAAGVPFTRGQLPALAPAASAAPPGLSTTWSRQRLPLPGPGWRPGSAPLTAATLETALAGQGVTYSDYVTTGTLQGLRITVQAPDYPPAWPGDPAPPATSSPSSGWLVWPLSAPVSGLVLFAHGCCEVPADLADQAAAVAGPTNALVLAMDYRNPTTYDPDTASEDSAAGVAAVKAALPKLGPTVAYGLSEGGAVTALTIEHHPGLIDKWLDLSGPVDLLATAAGLSADLAPLAQNVDPVLAQQLLDLLGAAVAPGIDPVRVAALSPIQHASLLAGLQQAVVVQATGDEVVPYANSAELVGDLTAAGVPTRMFQLVPAAGQPATSMGYHITTAAQNLAYSELNRMLSPLPVLDKGLLTVTQPIAIG